jgi:hypothetical protein
MVRSKPCGFSDLTSWLSATRFNTLSSQAAVRHKQNSGKHGFCFLQNFMISKTQYRITALLQIAAATGIVCALLSMLPAIGLYNQTALFAHKIGDIPAYRHLTTEFITVQASAPCWIRGEGRKPQVCIYPPTSTPIRPSESFYVWPPLPASLPAFETASRRSPAPRPLGWCSPW